MLSQPAHGPVVARQTRSGLRRSAPGGGPTCQPAQELPEESGTGVLSCAILRPMPLILILVILLLLFGGGGFYMGPGVGYYGGGGISLILLLVILYLFFGRGSRSL